MPTKIEWTDETWNPVTGCTKVSAGCANCYAERMARRLAGRYGYPADEPFRVTFHRDRLHQPWHWRKPRRVFVCSMGDLFHPDVTDDQLGHIFLTMNYNRTHVFQVLTKRPQRALDYLGRFDFHLPHVWLGVSAENQESADERIPILLQTPAAVRFVSIEPMLGPVDLSYHLTDHCGYYCDPPDDADHYMDGHQDHRWEHLDWVIVGGETGPAPRRMAPEWIRTARDQCIEAGVPFFFKSWGDWWHLWKSDEMRVLDGREWNEMPS